MLWLLQNFSELIISVAAPILGSLIGVINKPKESIIYHMFSLAGGIMLAISFIELIPKSIQYSSLIICIYGLILGTSIMYLLDIILPNHKDNNIKSISIILTIGISLHNISEGMAIAISSMLNDHLSFVVALGIAVHNIAEGICTSAPLYYSFHNKLKAFIISSFTALPLLIGFIIVYCFFQNASEIFFGLLLSITAGIMIYISANELIPYSSNKFTDCNTIYSLTIGIIFVIILENV